MFKDKSDRLRQLVVSMRGTFVASQILIIIAGPLLIIAFSVFYLM